MPLRHLGYACINTELRKKNIFCSRTCRLKTIQVKGEEHLFDLALKNVNDLYTILKHNEENNIKFFRISSDLLPFYAKYDYHDFMHENSGLFDEIGGYIEKHSHRLTTHPGQYSLLNSDRQEVIENCVKDLLYHRDFLNALNTDDDSIIILHGGAKGKKPADKRYKLQLLHDSIRSLPYSVRTRLVLENDEVHFSVRDLLPVCESTDIPLVLDYHHDSLYKTEWEFLEINKTWRGRTPKRHVSDSRDPNGNFQQKRAHHDYVKSIPEITCDIPVDIMIEAKMKEQALYKVR